MAQIHLLARPSIGYVAYVAMAFTEKADAEQWLEANVAPAYHKEWAVQTLQLYDSYEASKA